MSLLLPHLPIEARPAGTADPAAVTDGAGAHRRLIACNEPALRAGISAGMDVPSALMRVPMLRLLPRSQADERRALHALAGWAQQFTATVSVDLLRWTLWLEIGASLGYFGGLDALRSAIDAGLAQLGYTARTGIAPTPEAAALLAAHPEVPAVLTLKALRARLSPLALTHLAVDARTLKALQASGIRTCGELLQLPPPALARRFGAALPQYLRRLLGEESDPRPRHTVPEAYRRRCGLPEPVDALEALLFPLRRLLLELEGWLRGRDAALQRLTVTLAHRSMPDTQLELITSSPQREAVRLFALLREKLERTMLHEPVSELRIAATELVAPQALQGDFFDDRARRQHDWSALLDKLRARLGSEAVRRLGLRDDHRPEHAWCIRTEDDRPPANEGGSNEGGSYPDRPDSPDRPLWLLEPTPIARLPKLFGAPERIEAGWWAGEDTSRDYYVARTPEGARWWIYRDGRTGKWFLQGLWA